MIFKSKKALEEEICRRVAEVEDRNRIDRRLFELEDQVRNLKWKVDSLEERKEYGKTPVAEVGRHVNNG